MFNPAYYLTALGLTQPLSNHRCAISVIPGRDAWHRECFGHRKVPGSKAVARRRKHRAMTKAMRQMLRRR